MLVKILQIDPVVSHHHYYSYWKLDYENLMLMDGFVAFTDRYAMSEFLVVNK